MAIEKRLIDANELKKLVCETCNLLYSDEPCEPSDCYSMEYIDKLPTVDAVEVVRCKDCKWYGYYECGNYLIDTSDGSHLYTQLDDFCSYGERKDNVSITD